MKSVCKCLSGRSIAILKSGPVHFWLLFPNFHAIVQGEKRFKLNIFSLKKFKVSINKAMCVIANAKGVFTPVLLNEPFSATDIRGRQ